MTLRIYEQQPPWFTLFNTQPKELPSRLKKEFSSQAIHGGIEYSRRKQRYLKHSNRISISVLGGNQTGHGSFTAGLEKARLSSTDLDGIP